MYQQCRTQQANSSFSTRVFPAYFMCKFSKYPYFIIDILVLYPTTPLIFFWAMFPHHSACNYHNRWNNTITYQNKPPEPHITTSYNWKFFNVSSTLMPTIPIKESFLSKSPITKRFVSILIDFLLHQFQFITAILPFHKCLFNNLSVFKNKSH